MKYFKSFLASAMMLVGILYAGNVSAQINWKGTAISGGMATQARPIYLYNVGAQAFFINGEIWGSQAALNIDYGMPFMTVDRRTNGKYRLTSALQTNEGKLLTAFAPGGAIFCDGETNRGDAVYEITFEAAGENNAYYVHFNGSSSKKGSVNVYMTADPIVGNSKKGTISSTSSPVGDYSKWIIITTDEIETQLKKTPADLDNPVNVTYMLKDPNLDRGNIDEANWKMVDWNQWTETVNQVNTPVAGREYRIGYQSSGEYYYMTLGEDGNLGRSRNAMDAAVWKVGGSTGQWTFQCNGKYLSRNTLTYATTSSTPTTWTVNSNGISNTTFGRLEYILGNWWVTFNVWDSNNGHLLNESMVARSGNGLKLGVQNLNKTKPDNQGEKSCSGDTSDDYRSEWGKYFGAEARGVYGKFQQQVTVHYAGWYSISCQGFFDNEDKSINDVVSLFATVDGKTNSQFISFGNTEGDVPADWHAAAKELFPATRYTNAIMFQVELPDADADGYSATGKTITIGLDWNEETSDIHDWTVFDDFQLEFLGYNGNLILEENTLDYDYLKSTKETYKNSTLLLNRTFTPGKWNTLVLPVDLTKKQFLTAFGANARIADLTKVRNGVLSFVTITKSDKADNSVLLEANKPYIVYVEYNPQVTTKYEATLTPIEGSGFIKKSIGGPDAPYYMVPRVTLDKANLDEVYAYTYEDGEASVTFDGTLVKTYEGTEIRPGFDNMIGKIIFKGGKLWWLTEKYGMKAYRAWLYPQGYLTEDTSDAAAKISFEIDGIEDSATEIHDIFVGGAATAEKFANGIYSINGMNMGAISVDNLPKGIYIVNGKKYIVK